MAVAGARAEAKPRRRRAGPASSRPDTPSSLFPTTRSARDTRYCQLVRVGLSWVCVCAKERVISDADALRPLSPPPQRSFPLRSAHGRPVPPDPTPQTASLSLERLLFSIILQASGRPPHVGPLQSHLVPRAGAVVPPARLPPDEAPRHALALPRPRSRRRSRRRRPLARAAVACRSRDQSNGTRAGTVVRAHAAAHCSL